MNDDERMLRLADLATRVLHTVALARMILGQTAFPVALPQVFTPDTMPVIWDAIRRCLVLLGEEPMVSLIPGQANELLRQGLAKTIVGNDHLTAMYSMEADGVGDKLEDWHFLVADIIITDADVTLHLAFEELNGDLMDD